MMKPTMGQGRMLLAILVCMTLPLTAQFQAPLEAESPEEFDLYLTVEETADAATVAARSEAFRRRYPTSKLLPRVWELRYFALQTLGKAGEARMAGEEALRLAPGNLSVRAALAVQLASEDTRLAESHARAVLEELDRTKVRRTVPLERYLATAAKLRGQARVALGVALFRNGDAAGALRELEEAYRLAPEAAVSYRLGRLYAALGRTDEARQRLREAAGAADPVVAERGRAALAELR